MRLAIILTWSLLAIPTGSLRAQYASAGDTIKLSLAEGPLRVIEGTLTGISADSIFVSRDRQTGVRLARVAVRTVYVRREAGDLGGAGGWSGMSFGFLIGTVGGAIAAGPRLVGRMLGAAGGAVVGTIIGATAGEAIGSHEHMYRWVAIPWPSTPVPESSPR
jgi:hypothetical protein